METNKPNELFAGLESLVSGNLETVAQQKPSTNEEDNQENPEKVIPSQITPTVDEIEEGLKIQREEEEKAKKIAAENTEDDKGNNPENVAQDAVDSDTYLEMSEFFKSKGIVSQDFKSAEEMVNTFKAERQKDIDDYKAELPAVIKELIDNYEEGVPLENLISIKSEKIVLSNIDEESIAEDVELQKNLYREALRQTTKFDETKIERLVKQAEDLLEIEDRAKESLTDLLEINKEKEVAAVAKAKEDAAKAKQTREDNIKKIDTTVKSIKEIIPGIKITEAEQKSLFKSLTTAAEVRGNQVISQVMLLREKDPIDFEIKLNYFIQKGLFEGKFEDIIKKAESGATRKLEQDIEATAKKLAAKTAGNVNRVEGEEPSFFQGWKNRAVKKVN